MKSAVRFHRKKTVRFPISCVPVLMISATGTLNTSEMSSTVQTVGPSAVKKVPVSGRAPCLNVPRVSTSLIHGRFRTLPGRHRRAH